MDIREIIRMLNELDEQGNNGGYTKNLQEEQVVYDIGNALYESKLIEKAQKVKKANIIEDTYAVISLSEQYEPYKSLLLNMYHDNALSKESTNVLLNRLFKKIGMEQDALNECTKLLFDKKIYKLPYVYGGKAYLPINGSMRKSGNWIASHLIAKYGIEDVTKRVLVEFENGTKLLLDTSIKGFEIQLQRILDILTCQFKFVNTLSRSIIGLELKKFERDHLLLERKLCCMNVQEESPKAKIYFKKLLETMENRENKLAKRTKKE